MTAVNGKVLVTGASGLLGRALLKEFENKNWQVLGLAYSRASGSLRKVDLNDRSQVENVFEQFQPDIVIHAAAERRPDIVEKKTSQARVLNVGVTKSLAALCKKYNNYLLYISTDYVFDGKGAPYTPDAPTNPLNTYGLTKREGEEEVLLYPEFGILRVPILYGPVETVGESAVTTLFTAVKKSEKSAELNDYQRRYPTHVANVAEVCVHFAERQMCGGEGARGIWHFSGPELHTKYSMAVVMANAFGLSKAHLVPTKDSGGATRPYDCHLECSALVKDLNIEFIPFSVGIKLALEPFI